jgi:hypothetical protein
MPCDSVAIASTQLTGLAQFISGRLGSLDQPVRQALLQMLVAHIEQKVPRLQGDIGIVAQARALQVAGATVQFQGGQFTSQGYLDYNVEEAITSGLQMLGQEVIALLAQQDLTRQGGKITKVTTTPTGAKVIDFQFD